jgi:predicted O-methyltransferase YrrM
MRPRLGWRQFLCDVGEARKLGLPRRVALFYARARRLAWSTPDEFTLTAMTRADDLCALLRLAAGSRRIVEIGTGTGTTSIALALATPGRRIWSYDVKSRGLGPDAYLRLAPANVRDRVMFLRESGIEPSNPPSPVDFVFIDASHQREDTVATFRAWERHLAPHGTIVFHDYGRNWPGVAQAIDDLGLEGEVEGLLYVWRRSGV